MTDAAELHWSQLTLRQWRRYGYDRLYISTDDGQRLGYLDNQTGVLHVEQERHRATLDTLLAHHRSVALRRSTMPLPATAAPLHASPAERARKQRWQEGVARAARARNTLSEASLWHELERTSPYTWEREYVWGDYRLDFYCPVAQLAVEVDGSSHRHRAEADSERDSWFAAHGIETMRVTAAGGARCGGRRGPRQPPLCRQSRAGRAPTAGGRAGTAPVGTRRRMAPDPRRGPGHPGRPASAGVQRHAAGPGLRLQRMPPAVPAHTAVPHLARSLPDLQPGRLTPRTGSQRRGRARVDRPP